LNRLIYLQLEQGGSEEQRAVRQKHGWHPGREGSLPHHILQLDQGGCSVADPGPGSGAFLTPGYSDADPDPVGSVYYSLSRIQQL